MKILGGIICVYYDILMWLEDLFGGIATKVNNHRQCVDRKFWDKYLHARTLRR